MKMYSFKDMSFAFAHPLAGTFITQGQIGLGTLTISMAVERSVMDVAADGAVMLSYIAGDNGQVTIEVQQTSDLHAFLLAYFNLIKVNADAGDVQFWGAAAITIRNLLDGSTHVFTGIVPTKIPDKTYAAQGGKVVWTLMAAHVENLTA